MPEIGTHELSEREIEILKLVATGASNKEIAQRLFISANTVKVHLRNIFSKIEVTSRTEAAMYAVRNGLAAAPVSELAGVPENGAAGADAAAAGPAAGEPGASEPPAVEASPAPEARPTRSLWGIAAGFIVLVGIAFILIFFSRQPAAGTATPVPSMPTQPPRWRELAEMPTPRQGLAVAAYVNHIYAIGGESSGGVSGAVERFDPTLNTWEPRASKPTPAADLSAVVVGGLVYVPGGRLASGQPTDALEVYDPIQDRWETRSSLPVALSGYALAAFEGRIYLFGGWDGQKALDTVYEYDPAVDTWSRRAPMPTARAFAGAAAAGQRIYVLGGFDGEKALDANEIYSPDLDNQHGDPWSQGEPLPSPRYGMGVAAVADIIHMIGGQAEGESPAEPLEYFPLQDAWQPFTGPASTPAAWVQPGIAQLETHLFVIGGLQSGVLTGQNFSYQAIYIMLFPGVEQ